MPSSSTPLYTDSNLHRSVFRAHYMQWAQSHPESYLRQRIALTSPQQYQLVKPLSGLPFFDRFFSLLPDISIGVGVGPVSFGYGKEHVTALRDFIATIPLGIGAKQDDFEQELRRYMLLHPDEIGGMADAVYDAYTLPHLDPFDEATQLLKREFADGTDEAFSPSMGLQPLLDSAPGSFDAAFRAMDGSLTQETLEEIKQGGERLTEWLDERLNTLTTDFSGPLSSIMGDVADVRLYIRAEKDAKARLQRNQEMHAGVDVVSALLAMSDPVAARQFAAVGHNAIKTVEAIASLAAGFTLTGLAGLAGGITGIAQIFGGGKSEVQELQDFILELFQAVMEELAAIRRELFAIRREIAVLDLRIQELARDTSIGFGKLTLAAKDLRATLDAYALRSDYFYREVAVDDAETAHTHVVDLMTNPKNAEQRAALTTDPGGAVAVSIRQDLARIAQLGLRDSKGAPFVVALPLEGESIQADALRVPHENRVGDLAAIAALVGPHSNEDVSGVFNDIGHPVVIAQAIAWYLDAADRLPRPKADDGNFTALCGELRKLDRAADAARRLCPAALRFLASAIERVRINANVKGDPDRPIDADVLRGKVPPPLPLNRNERVQMALGAERPPRFVSLWAVDPNFEWVVRKPTEAEVSILNKLLAVDVGLGTGEKLVIGTSVSVDDDVVAVLGCIDLEDVVFDGVPKSRKAEFGFNEFYEADRVYVLERQRFCPDPPLVAPSKELLWFVAEKSGGLYRLPQVPVDESANGAGFARITRYLERWGAEMLIARNRQNWVMNNVRSLEHNNTRDVFVPEIGWVTRGCIEVHSISEWSPEAQRVAKGAADHGPAWTHSVTRFCLPDDVPMYEKAKAIAAMRKDDSLAEDRPVPDHVHNRQLENLVQISWQVYDARAAELFNQWLKALGEDDHPLLRAIRALRVARYALETVAFFGFGMVDDPTHELFPTIQRLTCPSGVPDCTRAIDERLLQPRDYLDFYEAYIALADPDSLRELAEDLEKSVAKTPDEGMVSAGPFGLREGRDLLNGLAKRNGLFPAGCQ